MLEYLHLKTVGPAPEMELVLGRRLNLLTGDNGLGKSFLLDVAWWL
jgi:predicted ATPase